MINLCGHFAYNELKLCFLLYKIDVIVNFVTYFNVNLMCTQPMDTGEKPQQSRNIIWFPVFTTVRKDFKTKPNKTLL